MFPLKREQCPAQTSGSPEVPGQGRSSLLRPLTSAQTLAEHVLLTRLLRNRLANGSFVHSLGGYWLGACLVPDATQGTKMDTQVQKQKQPLLSRSSHSSGAGGTDNDKNKHILELPGGLAG